jgi:hypothetical protein
VLVMERAALSKTASRSAAQMASSRYRRLLQAQEAVHARLTGAEEAHPSGIGAIVQEHGSSHEQR